MADNGNSDLAGGPQTLADIGKVLISGMVKNFKKMIPVMVAVFFGVWIFHTYVLVWINEGFRPGGTIYAKILALSGSELTGTLFWMILAFIATATVMQVKKKGPDGFIAGFKDVSEMFSTSKEYVSEEYQALLAAGAGICLFAGWFLGNFLVSFLLAVVLLFALSAKNESLLILCTRIGYSDIKRNFSGEKDFCPLDMQRTVLVFTGGIGGFVIAGIMPFLITLILAVLAVGFSAYWYYNKNNQGKNPPGAVIAAGMLFVILLCSFAVTPVVADDGGGTEAGGTFEGWIASEGASIAVIMGLPPAAGSVIGILIGILGVEGASAVIAAGGFGTGVGAGAAGAAGSTSTAAATGSAGTAGTSAPETKIYGTGTPDDPYRDEFTVGKTKEDGSLEPYPENKDKPKEIWGKGTKDDPYRDYPGDEAVPEPEEPVIEKPPETPPEEPVPEVPKEEPVPEPPKETPPEPQPPEPQPPEVEPPTEPPVVPPPEPPQPPAPPKAQPPEKQGPVPDDIQILKEKLERLEKELQQLKELKQKRNELEDKKVKAYRKYAFNGFRGIGKGAIEVTKVITDPKGAIWDGTKKKMDVKTPLDKAKDKMFGKEVEMKDIAEDMKRTKAEYDKIKDELNKMPSAEDLYKQGSEKMEEIRRLRNQIKRGGN